MDSILQKDDEEPEQHARPVASPQASLEVPPAQGAEGEMPDPMSPEYTLDHTWVDTVDTPSPATSVGMPMKEVYPDRQETHDTQEYMRSMMPGNTIDLDPEVSPGEVSPGSATTSLDGTQKVQPIVQPLGVGEAPAPYGGEHVEHVPDIKDTRAPRPVLGQPQISQEAIRQRAKRIFMPRRDGSLKVSQEIFKEWKAKGKERKNLEEIFKRCGYNAETWTKAYFTTITHLDFLPYHTHSICSGSWYLF